MTSEPSGKPHENNSEALIHRCLTHRVKHENGWFDANKTGISRVDISTDLAGGKNACFTSSWPTTNVSDSPRLLMWSKNPPLRGECIGQISEVPQMS
jgi:hypothetical protein